MFFTAIYVNAQWKYYTKNDPFDGKMNFVTATGFGGDSPYSRPSLVFRQNSNNELAAYITGAGYTGCDDPRVIFSFGSSDDLLEFNLSESVNRKAGFFNLENDLELFFNLVNRLKSESIVYVRFRTRCSINQFKISLNGSSNALNKSFYKSLKEKMNIQEDKKKKEQEWFDKYEQILIEKKQKEQEILQKNEQKVQLEGMLLDSIYISKTRDIPITKDSRFKLNKKLDELSKLNDSISVEFQESLYSHLWKVNVINGNGDILFSKSYKKLDVNSKVKSRIDSLLLKYENKKLKVYLKKVILNNSNFYKRENNIDNIKLKVTSVFDKKVRRAELVIILNSRKSKKIILNMYADIFILSDLPKDLKINFPY